MTKEETESADTVTAANIQRIESGYFDHMESLRTQIPVGEYIAESSTNNLSLLAMAGAALVMLALFPVTMFRGFSLLVILLWLGAFLLFAKVFYDRVIVPNEGAESWSD